MDCEPRVPALQPPGVAFFVVPGSVLHFAFTKRPLFAVLPGDQSPIDRDVGIPIRSVPFLIEDELRSLGGRYSS
jgi:hypothetical protein